MPIVRCKLCGNTFEAAGSNAKFCPECKKTRSKVYKKHHKEWEQNKKARERAERKKALSIEEAAKMARDAGMSYGEYVLKYLK